MCALARNTAVALFLVVTGSSAAYAQASIAGVVKDTSGAVLPGVTVEASSPALIEKTRSVVTDSSGQYKIEQLRPGMYAVTFSLAGFSTIKREGIELGGSFVATINADLKVGSIAETVTVTGESPLVDVQSAAKQRVIGNEVLTDIPTGRTQLTAATLIPGMNLSNQDVGGTNIINTTGGSITIHGGNGNDQRVTIDGVSTANAEIAGQASNFLPNFGSIQEVAVDYSSGAAEQAYGGVRINIIPREGGNAFKGTFFGTAVNSSFQGSNLSQDLINRGFTTPNAVKLEYDINPGFGGPIRRDSLWFYASARYTRTANYVGGMFANLNAGNPNAWAYVADPSNRGVNNAFQRSLNGRLTWQANPKNKFSFFADDQGRCQCTQVASNRAPEAAISIVYPIQRMVTLGWTAPLTNRLLVEARGGFREENYEYNPTPAGDPSLNLIMVQDLGGPIPGMFYHGPGIGGGTLTQPFQNTDGRNFDFGGSVSYITGSHAFRTGISDTVILRDESLGDNNYHVHYTFNSPLNPYVPTPIQITERTTPYLKSQRQPAGIGLFVQDKWTLGQLTLNLGVRFDYLKITIPAQHLGPAPLVPTRNIDLPAADLVSWKDLSPRLAGSYDLFRNGKTAVRASLNRYVVAQGVQGMYGDSLAPVNRLANFVTRQWTDSNHNFFPDCDLTNPFFNGECGTMSDTNFGQATPSLRANPAAVNGFGVRPYGWEFSTGVQHELLPRVSVDIGYFRRWFGNFAVVDNLALARSDFSAFSVTAPLDSRLPGGGGQSVGPILNINPNKVGRQDLYLTVASDYGEQIQHWNGVDLTVNVRPRGGMLLQGGLSAGRTVTDNCAVLAQVPEASTLSGGLVLTTGPSPTGLPYCHQEENLLRQLKFLGSYTVPKVDVQLSGSFQSIPGPPISASQVITSAMAQPLLGRPLAGASTVSVNLVPPGTLYGDRLNQLDMRFSKLLRFSGTKTSVNLDLYNLFNSNAVLAENATYRNTTSTGWRVPTSILTARFAKISVQLDF